MSPSHWIPSAAPRSHESINPLSCRGASHSHEFDRSVPLTTTTTSSSPRVPIQGPEPPPPRRDVSSPDPSAVDRPEEEGDAPPREPPSRPQGSPAEVHRSPQLHHPHHRHLPQHQLQQQQRRHHQHNHRHSAADRLVKHKRRYCRVPGCKSIVKSQGVCQRHGAKPRKCRVETCTKQAQGNFDGMCKVHYKALRSCAAASETVQHPSAVPEGGYQDSDGNSAAAYASTDGNAAAQNRGVNSSVEHGAAADRSYAGADTGSKTGTPPPSSSSSGASEPVSVYDGILPASLAWRSVGAAHRVENFCGDNNERRAEAPSGMPLVEFLARNGSRLSRGWHRRQERLARGCSPVSTDSDGEEDAPASHVQWDDWERELIWTELLLLMGAENRSDSMMNDLAQAWGCPPGFHTAFISQWIGERQTAVPIEFRAEGGDGDYAEPDNDGTASEGDEDFVGMADNVEEDAGYSDDDQDAAMSLPETGATPVIGADAWDDACYTAHSYNEALASDLLLDHLGNSSPRHTAMDGLHHMMDHHHDGDSDGDDDQDRITDDASCSSREEIHRAQISDE